MNSTYQIKMRCKPEKREIFDIVIENLSQSLITSKNKYDSTRIKQLIHNEVLSFFKKHKISSENFKKLK